MPSRGAETQSLARKQPGDKRWAEHCSDLESRTDSKAMHIRERVMGDQSRGLENVKKYEKDAQVSKLPFSKSLL